MKRTFFAVIFTVFACVYISCGKEETSPIPVSLPDIVGTWNATDGSHFKILFYLQDGTLFDSTDNPTDDLSFVFHDSINVDAPWEVPCTYSLTPNTLSFNLAGLVTRDYTLDEFTEHHLAFHRVDTSTYQTTGNNETIDVIGIEYEIWDLTR